MALEYVRIGHTPSNGYGNKPFRGSITKLSPLSSVLRILTPEMTQRAPRCKISCLAWARQLSEWTQSVYSKIKCSNLHCRCLHFAIHIIVNQISFTCACDSPFELCLHTYQYAFMFEFFVYTEIFFLYI